MRLPATETEASFFEKRFMPEPNTGCFLWLGSRHVNGLPYGKFKWKGKDKVAHRASWELRHGTVPAGLFVCHRCDTPECVNPDHLFLGTHADNMADKVRKNRQSRSRLGGGRGTRNGHAKLSEKQVIEIAKRVASGETQREVASAYGVSHQLVSMIATGRIWKHARGLG